MLLCGFASFHCDALFGAQILDLKDLCKRGVAILGDTNRLQLSQLYHDSLGGAVSDTAPRSL